MERQTLSLAGIPWRLALVGVDVLWRRTVDYGVDEINLPVYAVQDIVGQGIENVIFAVGEIFTVHLRIEAHHDQCASYLLYRGFTVGAYERLRKDGAGFALTVRGEAGQRVGTIGEKRVVREDSLKERREVVVGIAEVVEFVNSILTTVHIDFVFRSTVGEHAQCRRIFYPKAITLGKKF